MRLRCTETTGREEDKDWKWKAKHGTSRYNLQSKTGSD